MLGHLIRKLKKTTRKIEKRLSQSSTIEKIREKTSTLETSKKSIFAKVFAGVIVLVLIWQLAVFWNKKEESSREPILKEEEITTKMDDLLQETWIEKASELVTKHEQEITDIQVELKQMKENMGKINEMFTQIMEKLEKGIPAKGIPKAKKAEKTKKVEVAKKTPVPEKVEEMYKKRQVEITKYPSPQPYNPTSGTPSGQGVSPSPKGKAPGTLPGGLIYAEYSPPEEKTKEEEALKKMLLFPAGSFARAVLLTGVNAPTGMKAKTQPQPVILLLKDLAFLPNDFRADVDRCMMVGEAYGELASERVYVRVNRISCIGEDKKIYVAQSQGPIGYVVDRDGRIGLAGRVYSRQGLLLARSLVANFIEGVARAFRASLTTVSVTPLGGTITADQSTSDAFKIALGEGAAKSLESLAKMYEELASQTFPVIVVSAGRSVNVALLQPVEFKVAGILSEKI